MEPEVVDDSTLPSAIQVKPPEPKAISGANLKAEIDRSVIYFMRYGCISSIETGSNPKQDLRLQ